MLSIAGLLLLSLFVLTSGEEFIVKPNQIKVHNADLFQLKCHSLLYRSVIMDDLCYFAIDRLVFTVDAEAYCDSVLPGSKFETDRSVAGVLGGMLLKSDDFHSGSTQSSKKGVLCKYVNPFTCKDTEKRDMRGRCVARYDVKLNFALASKHCADRNSYLPRINNDDENTAIARVVALSSDDKSATAIVNLPYWVDQSMTANKWRGANSDPVQYFYWLVGKTKMPLNCAVPSAVAVSTKIPVVGCVAYAKWQPAAQTEQRQVVCVRGTDSDFNPKYIPPPTTPAPYPKNNPPLPEWTWMLRYYYNYGRILHGFCADSVGCHKMFNNGIGYSGSAHSGNMGRTITREGMLRMPEVCADNHHKLRPLYFSMVKVAWVHNFGGQGLFAGYVATQKGVCGAKYDMWGYSCAFSGDAMYAQNLEWNTFYRGRSWGAIAFVLW